MKPLVITLVGLLACSSPGSGGGVVETRDGFVFGDAGQDDATSPDATLPDAVQPDGTLPDGTSPDGTAPDTTVDVTTPDGSDALLCLPNELVCNGQSVVRCRPDGAGLDLVETCGAEEVCANGECLGCFPTQRRCSAGGASEICGDDGLWTVAQDCAAAGLTCFAGQCQSPCTRDPKNQSNSGCDYWAVDMDNHIMAQNGPFALIVSNLSEHNARVKITRKDAAGQQAVVVVERDVPSGELSIFDLPNRNMGAAGIFWSAYRVESTAPIVAYQFNPLDNVDVFSNDASLLLPSNTYGREYFVVSRFELLGQGATQGSTLPYRGEINVVAAAAATNVTVVPTCQTQAGTNMPTMMPGQSYTYALEPYQVLNIKSNQNNGDLTGTLVTADKPIAVFGGHEAALSADACCADHLEHQMFPVATWGEIYVATKSKPRGLEPDYWRIMASQDGTTVSFAPGVATTRTLGRGQWFEFSTTQDFVVSADKPISVAQLLASSGEVVSPRMFSDCTLGQACAPGYSCEIVDFFTGESVCYPPACTPGVGSCPQGHVCATYNDGSTGCSAVGDPTLIMVPPTKQFRKDYVFLSPNKYAQDFINVVAPATASVTLDGALIPAANFTTIAGSSWKVARVAVGDGTHKVVANEPVSVIAYGYDRDVSYGYAAGLNLVTEQ